VNRYKAKDTGLVLPVQVNVVKVNPRLQVVFYDTVELAQQGSERTAVRFTVNRDGSVSSINTLQKNLVQQ
jgi:hypothetical protein